MSNEYEEDSNDESIVGNVLVLNVPDDVTRFGKSHKPTAVLGTEERFQWQKSGQTSDVMYDIPSPTPAHAITFGSSLRKGMDDENPDAKKRSTGPGSYDIAGSYDHNSEYAKHEAGRFGQAPRQSMAMKTPSAGAVYNIDKQFWNGPEKSHGVGFANAARGELHGSAEGVNADMYAGKSETGPAITIAKKLTTKEQGSDTPGAIYDVHEKVNFQTGPAYSFGHGKESKTMEMPALVSSPTRQHSAPDNVTRFGKIKEADLKFGSEQRFRWQTTGETSDVAYDVQDAAPVKSVIFGSSLRKGMDEENPDAKKRSTGPGSYDIAGSYDHNSEYAKHEASRFGQAPRQSMAMKTPSAGAVYNIDKQFWNGPEKSHGVGFANAARGELHGSAEGVNADMYAGKSETGPAITIAKKLTTKEQGSDTPGAIYDVHEKVNFQTGPAYSFGHGKESKTMEMPALVSSPTRQHSAPDNVTRFGKIKEADLKFGSEQRFRWQTTGETSDVAYDVQDAAPVKSVIFGSSLRKGMDEENPDAKKRSTGPGSYDIAGSYDHNSEYAKHEAGRFGQAPRQSMAMKTPSAGAVYNIDKQFWNGPERTNGVGFANATRGELYGTALSVNADMFLPKQETGPAITIAKKLTTKELGADTPGPIYQVHVSYFLSVQSLSICIHIFTVLLLLSCRKRLTSAPAHRTHLDTAKYPNRKNFCPKCPTALLGAHQRAVRSWLLGMARSKRPIFRLAPSSVLNGRTLARPAMWRTMCKI